MAEQQVSRRERYRQETRNEIKERALRQLTEQGPGGLSLNALAREMGMTGPALYRYFTSRDALLTELVTDAYRDLGDALWASVAATEGRDFRNRLRHQAEAYRAWALANRARFLLLFGTPVPGYEAPAEITTPAAERSFAASWTLLETLADRVPPARDGIERALERWAAQAGGPPLPGPLLRYAFASWTRLHGVLMLEMNGQFGDHLPPPALIYEAEVEALDRELAALLE